MKFVSNIAAKRTEYVAYARRVLTALPEDTLVELAHLRMGSISAAVAREREAGDHPVKRSEAVVKVRVYLGVVLGEGLANLFALERARRSEDSHLSEDLENGECAPLVDVVHLVGTEDGVGVEVIHDLMLNHADIRAELVDGERDLNELLLLHELFVRAVIYDVLAEDGCSQGLKLCISRGKECESSKTYAVNILCCQFCVLASKNVVVTLSAKGDGDTSAEENEGKAVAILMEL